MEKSWSPGRPRILVAGIPAGGDNSITRYLDTLAATPVSVYAETLTRALPDDVDGVIIAVQGASHNLSGAAKEHADRLGVPVFWAKPGVSSIRSEFEAAYFSLERRVLHDKEPRTLIRYYLAACFKVRQTFTPERLAEVIKARLGVEITSTEFNTFQLAALGNPIHKDYGTVTRVVRGKYCFNGVTSEVWRYFGSVGLPLPADVVQSIIPTPEPAPAALPPPPVSEPAAAVLDQTTADLILHSIDNFERAMGNFESRLTSLADGLERKLTDSITVHRDLLALVPKLSQLKSHQLAKVSQLLETLFDLRD